MSGIVIELSAIFVASMILILFKIFPITYLLVSGFKSLECSSIISHLWIYPESWDNRWFLYVLISFIPGRKISKEAFSVVVSLVRIFLIIKREILIYIFYRRASLLNFYNLSWNSSFRNLKIFSSKIWGSYMIHDLSILVSRKYS